MIDNKTLEYAFETKETAEKQLGESKIIIQKAAEPLILSVLRRYYDRTYWPGMTAGDITKKVHELYDKRFSEMDITAALITMHNEGEILNECIGQRRGYKLKP